MVFDRRQGVVAKKIHELLNAVVPTKVIGNVHPPKGGR